MKKISEKLDTLFQIDGIFFLESVSIEEEFEESIEGAEELAKNQVDNRIKELERKAYLIDHQYRSGSFKFTLFGGRVIFSNFTKARLSIDGISIQKPDSLEEFKATSEFYDTSKLIGFLNIISKVGVDMFLENYKKEMLSLIEKLEIKLKSMEELYKLEGTIEKNASTLLKYWNNLKSFHNHGFILGLWMMPGIENEVVCNAYDKLQIILSSF